MVAVKSCRLLLAHFAQPAGEQFERIVPEGVNLDGLPPARGDDPVIHLRVHPGKLVAFLALAKQSVFGFDMKIKIGPAQMMLDDVAERWQEGREGGAIASRVAIAAKRVKKPERRVRRVIKPFLLSIGKH